VVNDKNSFEKCLKITLSGPATYFYNQPKEFEQILKTATKRSFLDSFQRYVLVKLTTDDALPQEARRQTSQNSLHWAVCSLISSSRRCYSCPFNSKTFSLDIIQGLWVVCLTKRTRTNPSVPFCKQTTGGWSNMKTVGNKKNPNNVLLSA